MKDTSDYLVLGAGFGDEGKGVVVDWIAGFKNNHFENKPIVQRFSGGPQAGHTVFLKDKRHIFSTFGSGTFRGLSTYISKYCLFNPISALMERDILSRNIDAIPPVYLDADAVVITPADVLANRYSEIMRDNGTCGSGIGTTMEREENHYSLRVADLYNASILRAKYSAIINYYSKKYPQINPFINDDTNRFYLSADSIRNNLHFLKTAEENLYVDKFDPARTSRFIYEGSQGLMLDPEYGIFPNVTRTNTGTQKIYDMLDPDNISIFLVTRAYTTRHGGGWLNTEGWNDDILIKNNLETNVKNPYQGELRYGLLDLSLLSYVISKDKFLRENSRKISVVVTCIDQMNKFRLINTAGRIIDFDTRESFLAEIYRNVPAGLYINTSNESETIERI